MPYDPFSQKSKIERGTLFWIHEVGREWKMSHEEMRKLPLPVFWSRVRHLIEEREQLNRNVGKVKRGKR